MAFIYDEHERNKNVKCKNKVLSRHNQKKLSFENQDANKWIYSFNEILKISSNFGNIKQKMKTVLV